MNAQNPKMLIVDDSSTMRRILKMTLNRLGYTDITEAGDGKEALGLCQEQTFECVLTDWNLPVMEGVELITRLRAMPAYTKTPIMMVTAEGTKDDVIEALSRGANAYIVKPFTPDILKKKMAEILGT